MSDGLNVGEDWTRLEVEAAVADYLSMLATELRGETYNKAEHNRALQAATGRRRGSIERKHQNISAVLRELGQPWINGYKPLGNYQELLGVVLDEHLAVDRLGIRVLAAAIVDAAVPPLHLDRIDQIQVEPPEPEPPEHTVRESKRRPVPQLKNYVEIDARNRALGLAGEEFIVEFETKRLWDGGRTDLAKQVAHVAATQGDGLGYDVGSYELDARPRLIEVKTTSFGQFTPFFVSKSEVGASERLAPTYQLYRLFNFRKRAQFFALKGALTQTCRLDPVAYAATVA